MADAVGDHPQLGISGLPELTRHQGRRTAAITVCLTPTDLHETRGGSRWCRPGRTTSLKTAWPWRRPRATYNQFFLTLLHELQKTYAMAEEHAVHGGSSHAAPAATAADEITFF